MRDGMLNYILEIRMSVQATVTEITGVTEDELLVTFSFAEVGII